MFGLFTLKGTLETLKNPLEPLNDMLTSLKDMLTLSKDSIASFTKHITIIKNEGLAGWWNQLWNNEVTDFKEGLVSAAENAQKDIKASLEETRTSLAELQQTLQGGTSSPPAAEAESETEVAGNLPSPVTPPPTADPSKEQTQTVG